MTRPAGLVLAGGRSRRFGPEDKALAELDGEPLLARVADRLSSVVDELVVSCRPPQVDRFERTLSTVPVDRFVEDRVVDVGPLAGFEVVSAEYTAIVACDMPLVEPAVVEELFERAEGSDAAVPKHADGQLQPVQTVYRTGAMQDAVERMLPEGGSLHEAVNALDVTTVPPELFPKWSFHNVNTHEDLVAAERRRTDR